MAGLLDQLTHENPVERVPTVPGGRDEINAMAISLNTLADHKATFFNWWRSSMQEAISLRDLHQAADETERFEAAEELRTAALSKIQQINALRGQIGRHTERILEVAERDRADMRAEDRATLRNAAAGIDTLLNVLDEG
jgi:methyl-accepting chemotaxis protein